MEQSSLSKTSNTPKTSSRINISYYKPLALLRKDIICLALVAIILAFLPYSNYIPENYSQYYLIFYIVVLIALSILSFLFTQWSIEYYSFIAFQKVKNVKDAKVVKASPPENKGRAELCPIQVDSNGTISFLFQRKKFIFNSEQDKFVQLDFPIHYTFQKYLDADGIHNVDTYFELQNKYGLNKFDIPIPSFYDLYKEQAVAPFFVFQVFCVLLWCLDEYWYYSIFTLIMLLIFEGTVVNSRLKNLQLLREMVVPPTFVKVYRQKKWISIQSYELVPGDLISLGRGSSEFVCPADILLLSGSCVVNEAMLTGESTPRLKESIIVRKPNEIFDIKSDSRHVLFGGTKIIQQQAEKESGKKGIESGCVGYVLKTGFYTKQGKLMRLILFSTERVTANSRETLAFILFLVVFALVASGYVLVKGLEDESRSKYKLLLNCIMIITSVIPPELPMELSLAVNNSLIALSKLNIFCTEPFRIPFAGKVDVCCFDKTGTLTSEKITFLGVSSSLSKPLSSPTDISDEAAFVLAGCHSLINADTKLMGDPMEIAALTDMEWYFSKNDSAAPKRGPKKGLRIIHRHPFTSSLKRMSTLASVEKDGNISVYVLAKGAPETIFQFLDHSKVPSDYEENFKAYTRQGYRVIALAYKILPKDINDKLKQIPRESIESNLIFAGFAIFQCPLKKDSSKAITILKESSHEIIMITGDNPLTACQVAKDLKLIAKPVLLFTCEGTWTNIEENQVFEAQSNGQFLNLSKNYDFCITGDGLSKFLSMYSAKLLRYVGVYARVSPQQKEAILMALKNIGKTTLMCGDGTNDVGALKQAHVGVAVLNKSISKKKKLTPAKKQNELFLDETQIVQLGDASIASPFTSKSSSVLPITDIIRQGRCTLVTTMQMFKILALNCLISAYTLSVLYLDGVKLGDTQATIFGMLIAFCFLFISRSKPSEKLSKLRPPSRIFSGYMITSIFFQFIIHLSTLIYLVQQTNLLTPNSTPHRPDDDFAPSLLNSVVFIISCGMHVSTFIVNYQGYPFMESLFENKGLFGCLTLTGLLALSLASETSRSFNEFYELVPIPISLRRTLVFSILFDFGASFLVEKLAFKLFVW